MSKEDKIRRKEEKLLEKEHIKNEKIEKKNKKREEWRKRSIFSKISVILGKIIRFFAKFFLVFFVLCFILGCVVGGYVGLKIWPMVEDYKAIAYDKFDEIGPNTFTYLSDTVIYDKNENVISEINVGNYKYAEIEDVSKWVQMGYISVEDKRFKVHNGIDYKALTRASLSLVKNKGKITQGGSTITQQVLKNNLLTQERTFKRKLIEFFLAPEFEKRYSKQDIMEFYVNTNFYGNNCYGIETASQYYFGKSAKDLTLAESALFVGMSNNASVYNPKKNLESTIEKQHFVLKQMLNDDVITEKEYNEYFGDWIQPFTGINMVKFYKELCEKENCKIEFIFSNNPKEILKYTKDVISCDIHTRFETKEKLKKMLSIY